jgi:hypothetical protein
MAHAITSRDGRVHGGRVHDAVVFTAKLIGIGIFAGLMITYCQYMIDACFRGLH